MVSMCFLESITFISKHFKTGYKTILAELDTQQVFKIQLHRYVKTEIQ